MQLPPPRVTGIVVPTELRTQSSQLENYTRLMTIRQQAQTELEAQQKKYKFKDKHKTPTAIKVFGITISAATLLYLGRKLFKK